MKFIVKLEDSCWLAPWSGDPGRTLVEANARRYYERHVAEDALTFARYFRPFADAEIVEVPE